MLFESYLRCCALAIIRMLEVSSLNVILDQKLNFICYCALRNTLSRKVAEFRVLDQPKTKRTARSYSLQ